MGKIIKTNLPLLKIGLLAFIFLFAFSIGAQTIQNQTQFQIDPVTQYLQENYGVSSIEELRAKLMQQYLVKSGTDVLYSSGDASDAIQWAIDHNDIYNGLKIEPYPYGGTSTYKPPNMQSLTVPSRIVYGFNPLAELSALSLSGICFLAVLSVPKFGKKLLKKKWLIYPIIIAFVFYAGFLVGRTVAQISYPNIYLDSLPSTATYTIETDGNGNYWATRYDGKIAFSGTDAAAVIQWALDNLTSGRTWMEKVVVKGTFEVSTTISIPSYTVLDIQGIIKSAESPQTFNVIEVVGTAETPVTHVVIENGCVDGNSANDSDTAPDGTRNCIIVNHARNVVVRNVHLLNGYHNGLNFYDDTQNCYAIGCYVENCGLHGILTKGIKNVIAHCFVTNTLIWDGIQVQSHQNSIIGNACYNNTYFGIDLHEGGYANTVIGNICRGNYVGITSDGEYHSIIGNICYLNTKQGISVQSSHTTVIGNICYDNSAPPANPGQWCGILIFDCSDVIVTGNQCFDSRETGKTQKYGLRFTGTVDGVIVANNDFRGNFWGSVTGADVPTNAIFINNLGFVTENSGTATIPSGTSVVFEHGLAGTPTQVFASFNSTNYGGWTWTANSTHITITVANTGSYTVYWRAYYEP